MISWGKIEAAHHRLHELHLPRVDERNHLAVGAGSRRTAAAMEVGRVFVDRIEVDHAGDAVDMDAAGRDIGGDQDVGLAVREVVEGAGALGLGSIAVNRCGLHPDAAGAASRAGRLRGGSG